MTLLLLRNLGNAWGADETPVVARGRVRDARRRGWMILLRGRG